MADASVSLDLDAQQLYRELQQVQSHFAEFASKSTTAGTQAGENFNKGFKGGFGSLGTNIVQGIAALGIGREIQEVIKYGSEIQDISERFGVSATSLQHLGLAATQTGTTLEAVAKGFRFLEVNREKAVSGNDAMVASFASLGVSFEELQTLSAEDLFLKVGQSSLNAADLVKVFGREAINLRPLLEGIKTGAVQFGDAMSDLDIARLDEIDDRLQALKQTLTVGIGHGLSVFVSGFQASIAEIVGTAYAAIEEAKGIATGFAKLAHLDIKGSGAALTAGHEAAKEQFAAGEAQAAEYMNPVAPKTPNIRFAYASEGESEAGETDEEGRPLLNKGKAAAAREEEKLDTQREKVEKKERDQELGELPKAERLLQLKKEAADAESLSTEARDEEDRLDAREQYLDITKEIQKTEKDIADDAKKTEKEVAAEKKKQIDDHAKQYKEAQTDALRAAEGEERRIQHERERTLNPANLTLHDIASARIIGNPAVQQAQEAEAEEKLAKERQLAGDLPGAREHKDRAEQLKKELGLENEIDREASFQKGLDKSEVLKSIRDNTADMKANKA